MIVVKVWLLCDAVSVVRVLGGAVDSVLTVEPEQHIKCYRRRSWVELFLNLGLTFNR
jgi:hypothetical protein